MYDGNNWLEFGNFEQNKGHQENAAMGEAIRSLY